MEMLDLNAKMNKAEYFFTRVIPSMLLLQFSLANTAISQNLVSNNSFETYTLLPNNYGEPCRASGWQNPNGNCVMVAGTGSPDFMHALGTYPVSLPNSIFGTCAAHTGSALMGFGTWSALISNYREYVSTTLSTPMVIGQSYTISFWMTAGKATYYAYRSNNIGIYLSTSTPVQIGSAPINVAPQCNVTSVVLDSAWTLYSFTIVPSIAYSTLTIGNFFPDASTTRTLSGPGSPNAAYYFIDDVVVTPQAPLPVEMISFEGKGDGDHVILDWATVSEINSDYFIVERSSPKTNFEPIGFVKSAGNSDHLIAYTFADESPEPGILYYRLKQVDFDGHFTYTSPISINFGFENSVCVVQYNPNSRTIKIIRNDSDQNDWSLRLLNLQGQVLWTDILHPGENRDVSMNESNNGIFLLQNEEHYFSTRKIIVY